MPFKFLLFLSLLLPFQPALNPAVGIDLASIRVLILLVFFLWLAASLKNKNLLIRNTLPTYLISIFLFLNLFSVFFARNTDWSARKLLFLFSIFPLYFVASSAIDSPEKMKKIIKALVLSAATVSTLGIVQFFSQFIFGIDKLQNFWAKLTPVFLGNAFSQAVAQYPSWLVNISGATYFRALGTFPDPHMFSFFLGLVLPLAVCLFFSENKPSWLFATGLIFLANILTFSRGGYLALVAGLLALFFIFWKRIGKKYKLAALLGSLALILALIVSNPVSERFFSSFNLQEGSNLGRIEIWKKTLKNISERPLTGTGIGNFPLAVDPLAEYRDPIYAHNTYLDIAVEAGILASLVWIGILFSSIRRFLQNSKGDILHLGAALSLIVFAAHSFVETGLYSPVVLTLLILILTFSNIQKIEKIS